MRQQATSWLDPRLAMDRVYTGAVRARRTLEFVDFLESQQATILLATNTFLGFRQTLATARRRLVGLGISALVVGALLYVVLADRKDTEAMLPPEVPYDGVHYGLLVLLVVIIVVLIGRSGTEPAGLERSPPILGGRQGPSGSQFNNQGVSLQFWTPVECLPFPRRADDAPLMAPHGSAPLTPSLDGGRR